MERKVGHILGYARVSTNQQDLEIQRQRLKGQGPLKYLKM